MYISPTIQLFHIPNMAFSFEHCFNITLSATLYKFKEDTYKEKTTQHRDSNYLKINIRKWQDFKPQEKQAHLTCACVWSSTYTRIPLYTS